MKTVQWWCDATQQMTTHYSHRIGMWRFFLQALANRLSLFNVFHFFCFSCVRWLYTNEFFKIHYFHIPCFRFSHSFIAQRRCVFLFFVLFSLPLFQFHFRSFKLQHLCELHLCKMCSTYKFLMLLKRNFFFGVPALKSTLTHSRMYTYINKLESSLPSLEI